MVPVVESQTMIRRSTIGVFLLILSFGILFTACTSGSSANLEQQQLFSLPIGRMEDQLDIYYDGVSAFDDKVRIVMQEGIIFIANSRGRKVMEFSSYGDLLSLYYNQSQNPIPVLLRSANDGNQVSSRAALSFPFLDVGEIAVSDSGILFVEDAIPENRAEYDEEQKAYLDRVVRRFDRSGIYLDYLGQEGVGGTPFPYINALYVNSSNDTIVVCRAERAWLVFWFSPAGNLKYKVTIPLTDLPSPDEPGILTTLERIVPDPEEDTLYIKIDTYKESRESLSGTGSSIEYFASYFYWLNPASGEYEGSLEVPHVVRKQDIPGLQNSQDEEVLHEFLGVAHGGFFFLMGPFGPDQYQLLVVDRQGVVIARPRINLQDREIFFRDFHLSRNGLLTAILIRDFRADVVWWRTDRLLEDETGNETRR
ncbi:LIC_12708 family protein [Marispirochaeta aestuarii]|uniref:LIC_12708 family protein n=1 Tax=Marispirochaeta aestuarii TaxID=1963862 RepID=UPI0029C641FE|nr:hypothetical protein [Marispirochaeta aestuarii]